MLIQAIYNVTSSRPHRWALKLVEKGDIIEKYWVDVEHYFYQFTKEEGETGTKHNVLTWYPEATSPQNFRPMRKHHIGFLTTIHRNFGEDTKYGEVLNDPVNYITDLPAIYGAAYLQAEQRIGNYRIGVRRNITHLGGTFSDDMLDALSSITAEDFEPVASLSFPFFPPKPADYTKAERINLLATDGGYVNYLKSVHPSIGNNETFLGEQGTGFRRIIWAANTLTTHATMLINPDGESRVEVEDIETVLDSAVNAATLGAIGDPTSDKFLPVSGQDITINISGQNIIRSTSDGISLELYDDTSFSNLTTLIDMPKSSGNMVLIAGTSSIIIAKDGAITIDDGTRSIILGTANIVLTTGDRTITITPGSGGTVDIT